jgi:hypothetical protein
VLLGIHFGQLVYGRTPRGPFIAPKGPIVVAPSFSKLVEKQSTPGAPDWSSAPLDQVHAPPITGP